MSAKGLAVIAAVLIAGCASKMRPPSNEREACARMPDCTMGPDFPLACASGWLHLDDSGKWYGCDMGVWEILPEFRPPTGHEGHGTHTNPPDETTQDWLDRDNGKPPKLMYAWTLPGSNVARTCILGEQFVDAAGQLYVCGQWPPYEKPE